MQLKLFISLLMLLNLLFYLQEELEILGHIPGVYPDFLASNAFNAVSPSVLEPTLRRRMNQSEFTNSTFISPSSSPESKTPSSLQGLRAMCGRGEANIDVDSDPSSEVMQDPGKVEGGETMEDTVEDGGPAVLSMDIPASMLELPTLSPLQIIVRDFYLHQFIVLKTISVKKKQLIDAKTIDFWKISWTSNNGDVSCSGVSYGTQCMYVVYCMLQNPSPEVVHYFPLLPTTEASLEQALFPLPLYDSARHPRVRLDPLVSMHLYEYSHIHNYIYMWMCTYAYAVCVLYMCAAWILSGISKARYIYSVKTGSPKVNVPSII